MLSPKAPPRSAPPPPAPRSSRLLAVSGTFSLVPRRSCSFGVGIGCGPPGSSSRSTTTGGCIGSTPAAVLLFLRQFCEIPELFQDVDVLGLVLRRSRQAPLSSKDAFPGLFSLGFASRKQSKAGADTSRNRQIINYRMAVGTSKQVAGRGEAALAFVLVVELLVRTVRAKRSFRRRGQPQ